MPRISRIARVVAMQQSQTRPAWSKFPRASLPFRMQDVHWPKKEWGPGVQVQYNERPKRPIKPIKERIVFRGDWVEVMAGPDTGKQGRIREVATMKNQLKIEGLNTKKRFIEDAGEGQPGFVMEEMPLHYREVALVNPASGEPMDAKSVYDPNIKDFVRVCQRTGAILHKPNPGRTDWNDRTKAPEGERDTKADVMQQHTYVPTLLRFHEEVMLECGISPTVPKTSPDRRDFIMQELRRSAEAEQAEQRLQQLVEGGGQTGLLAKVTGFFKR